MRRMHVAAAVVAVAAVLGAVQAAPALAAGPEYPRVYPVAASSTYLVYAQKTTNAYGLAFPTGRTLSFVGKSGHRHTLPTFEQDLAVSLQGSTAVRPARPNLRSEPGYDATAAEHVRWRDLKTGAIGSADLAVGDDHIDAAPSGWIAVRTTAAKTADGDAVQHVVRYATGGAVTDVGAPSPDNSSFQIAPGPAGVVAFSVNREHDGAGVIRYASFAKPGVWRTLYEGGTGVDTSCSMPSTTHVTRSVDADTAKHSGSALLALDGSTRAWLSDHPKTCQVISFVTVGRNAVGKATADQGSCVDGTLSRLGVNGRIATSKRLRGPHASFITAGFGRVLLDSPDQRRIVSLSGVTKKHRTIVSAH